MNKQEFMEQLERLRLAEEKYNKQRAIYARNKWDTYRLLREDKKQKCSITEARMGADAYLNKQAEEMRNLKAQVDIERMLCQYMLAMKNHIRQVIEE